MLSFVEHEKVFIPRDLTNLEYKRRKVTHGMKQFGYVSPRTKSGDQ